MSTNNTELLRKLRRKKLVLQQSATGSEDGEIADASPHESAWVEPSSAVEKIETTAEVVTEIPENVKIELKKKRKKLKELKKSSSQSQEGKSYDLERIEHDIGDVIVPRGPRMEEPQRKLPSIRKPSLETEGWFNASDEKEAVVKTSTPIKNNFQDGDKNYPEILEIKEISDIPSSVKIQIEEEQHIRQPPPRITKVPEATLEKDFLCDPSREVTEEEAYDFFTCVWEEEPQCDVPPPSSDSAKHNEQEETAFEEEVQNGEKDVAELLGKDFFKKEFEHCLTVHRKPSYMPLGERLKKEGSFFFNPSFRPVALDLKLQADKKVRDLADEGFFVGQRPSVPNRNINRLENRLIKQQETQWFGEDGVVKMLRNPVLMTSTRQTVSDEHEPIFETVYVKPTIHSSCKWHLVKEKSKERYQLDLDISSISFTHHPLFSQEHVLMSRLIQMCQKYNSNIQKDIMMGVKHRLKALRVAVGNLKQSVSRDAQNDPVAVERLSRLHAYQEDTRQTRKLRDLHEAEQRSLIKSIANTWNELKRLRDYQHYTSTSIRISIHEEPTDEAAEMEDWENELMCELQEEKEDFEIQYEKLIDEYNASLENWKQWKQAWVSTQMPHDSEVKFQTSI